MNTTKMIKATGLPGFEPGERNTTGTLALRLHNLTAPPHPMKTTRPWVTAYLTLLYIASHLYVEAQTFYVEQFPGLAFGLRHNVNQKHEHLPFDPPPLLTRNVIFVMGGDFGAEEGQGLTWFAVRGDPNGQFIGDGTDRAWSDPARNVALALRHSLNDRNAINLFGVSPSHRSARSLRDLRRMDGGDNRAPNHEGLFWYEKLGDGLHDQPSAWEPELPKGTILGLRHTVHQKSLGGEVWWRNRAYNVFWAEQVYVNHKHLRSADIYLYWTNNFAIPEGFKLMRGGDLGLEENEGFIWFEKTEGPEPFAPLRLVAPPPARSGSLVGQAQFDLETGTDDRRGKRAGVTYDLAFGGGNENEYLRALNGTTWAIPATDNFAVGADVLAGAQFSAPKNQISGYPDIFFAARQAVPSIGTVYYIKTVEGNFAKLRIRRYVSADQNPAVTRDLEIEYVLY